MHDTQIGGCLQPYPIATTSFNFSQDGRRVSTSAKCPRSRFLLRWAALGTCGQKLRVQYCFPSSSPRSRGVMGCVRRNIPVCL